MLRYFTSIVGGSSQPELPCSLDAGDGERAWARWAHLTGAIKPRASDPTESDTPVSVFRFQPSPPPDPALELAQSAVKHLRATRHPNVLSFKHSAEIPQAQASSSSSPSDSLPSLYLITERVSPLLSKLDKLNLPSSELEQLLSHGLKQLSSAISFLHSSNGVVHGLLGAFAVMVTDRLDFRLAAFDALGSCDTLPSRLERLSIPNERLPPELKSTNTSSANLSAEAVDAYGLGLIISDTFSACNCSVPESLKPLLSSLCARHPSKRTKPSDVASSQSLSNRASDTLEFISQLHLKDAAEKEAFFRRLPSLMERMSPALIRHKLLPEVSEALEFGSAPGQAVDGVLKAGETLSTSDFQSLVVPVVLKLFGNTDRIVRRRLLEHIEEFEPYLTTKDVDERVYPSLSGGFADTSAQMRELTLKAMSILAGKMSQRLLVSDLLKRLSRLQMDEEAAIRANTTIALGNMAHFLPTATAKRVLVNAFTRTLKDSSANARSASLSALIATKHYLEPTDVAQRVLPALAPLTIDQEVETRENALRALDAFGAIMHSHSEALKEKSDVNGAANGNPSATTKTSLDSSTSTLLSWASSFTQRLSQNASTPQMQQTPQQQQRPESRNGFSSPMKNLEEPSSGNGLLPSDAWSPSTRRGVESDATGAHDAGTSSPSGISSASATVLQATVGEVDDDDEGWEGFEDEGEDKREEEMRRSLASKTGAGFPSAQSGLGSTQGNGDAKGKTDNGSALGGVTTSTPNPRGVKQSAEARKKLGATKLGASAQGSKNDWMSFLNDDDA